MRMQLTKIEVLDQQYPGLADQVREWFCKGTSAKKVVALVGERYQVLLPIGTVLNFRSRRWVPEQKLLLEKKIALQAAAQVARDQAVRASLIARMAGEAQ